MRRITQFLICLGLTGNLLALSTVAQARQAATEAKLPKGAMLCPAPDELTKDPDAMTWQAKGGWRSFDKSFADSISIFLGAQWQGVEVGNVVCLYQSSDSSTFSVVLQYGSLTYQPIGGKWSKNLGGYENCKSKKRKDCYFTPKPDAKASGTLYQQAEQLKNDSGGQQEQGF